MIFYFLMKKILILSILCIFLNQKAFAVTEDKNTKEYVARIAKGIFEVVSNKKLKLEEQKQMLLDRFINEIDFNWNARASAGRAFRDMNDEQKLEFVKAYKQFLIRVWLPKFKGYNDETYKVGEENEVPGTKDDKTVPVTINLKDGKIITLELRVRKSEDGYKVLNVVAEGIDMARTYNIQFTEYVDKHGVAELIKYLQTGKSKEMAVKQ